MRPAPLCSMWQSLDMFRGCWRQGSRQRGRESEICTARQHTRCITPVSVGNQTKTFSEAIQTCSLLGLKSFMQKFPLWSDYFIIIHTGMSCILLWSIWFSALAWSSSSYPYIIAHHFMAISHKMSLFLPTKWPGTRAQTFCLHSFT